MTEPEKGWAYLDNGVVVYRASSIGNCVRSLVAARMGESAFPFHASIRAAMDASSGLEDVILGRGMKENIAGDVIWQQKTVELPLETWPDGPTEPAQRVVIRGHIDGLHQQSDTIIEAKALSALRNFPAFEEGYNSGGVLEALNQLGTLGEKYAWQAAIYGHATKRHVRFAIGEKIQLTSGEWDIGRTIVTEPIDPESLVRLTDIQSRIQDIETFAANDELPDCTANCKEGDPYSEVHFFDTPVVGGDDLVAKLARIKELDDILGSDDKKKRSGLLGEREDLKDAVKAEYGADNETRKVTAGPFTVTVVGNRGREYIDGKWLRQTYPDIAAQATKPGRPFRTLIIKGGEKKEETK